MRSDENAVTTYMPYFAIQPGSTVTIRTPQGERVTGRAVMRGDHGWVLNMGGAQEAPEIATAGNTVKVEPPTEAEGDSPDAKKKPQLGAKLRAALEKYGLAPQGEEPTE